MTFWPLFSCYHHNIRCPSDTISRHFIETHKYERLPFPLKEWDKGTLNTSATQSWLQAGSKRLYKTSAPHYTTGFFSSLTQHSLWSGHTQKEQTITVACTRNPSIWKAEARDQKFKARLDHRKFCLNKNKQEVNKLNKCMSFWDWLKQWCHT